MIQRRVRISTHPAFKIIVFKFGVQLLNVEGDESFFFSACSSRAAIRELIVAFTHFSREEHSLAAVYLTDKELALGTACRVGGAIFPEMSIVLLAVPECPMLAEAPIHTTIAGVVCWGLTSRT